MIISEHSQKSNGWHKERLGLPTASCFHKIITTRGNPSEQRKKYLYELAGEHLTGRPTDRYVSRQMMEKAEREPDSRLLYEIIHDVEIQEVGFCYQNEQKMFGASPDGLIDPDGGFESKDAEPHIQVMRISQNWNGMEHFQQVQGGMFVCERKWWDLQSYCEGMTPIIIRFKRDPVFIKKLEAELIKFCFELAMIVKKIRGI